MTVQKCGSSPSVSLIISVVSVLLYCAGFIRVEMKLNEHEKRMNAVENVVEVKLPTNIPNDLTKTTAEKLQEDLQIYKHRKIKRQADSARNASYSETKREIVAKMNKLLSEGNLQLCQTTKGATCPSGLPGPPGPPGPGGKRGARGRRGQKGKAGNNGIMGSPGKSGKQGIKGPPGKSGKQGIMGPPGLRGDTGPQGEKGSMGPSGMPGSKGEPGESISAPVVIVSPPMLTVNENEDASFQCSASGNPEPAVVWSKVSGQSVINQSAVSGGKLRLMNVTGNDSGLYQCTATNILGNARGLARLVVNVHPRVVLNPGPIHVKERSNVTLPQCHVTGYPPPVVTWSRPFHQLPQGRVQSNSGELKIFDVRKDDSDTFICTASNLLGTVVGQTLLVVVTLPKFTVKPPTNIVADVGESLTLNCSATGDPQPVISWKRQGAQLPVGRTHRSNDGLIIRNVNKEDAGNYICLAVSGGVFHVEAVSHIQVFDHKGFFVSSIFGNLHHRKYWEKLISFLQPVLVDSVRSKFVRCYHAKTDGWAASTFHSNCDGKGPTVTIIQVNSYIFGGYTNVAWESSCSYSAASKAFIFSLYNSREYSPVKLTQHRNQHAAMLGCSTHGPMFGRGHDIHITNDANSNSGSYTSLGSTYSPPSGCSSGVTSCSQSFLAGTYRFTPTDIEVFYETTSSS